MDQEDMKVEVIRSPRRKKTVQARVEGGTLKVFIPARMSLKEEKEWVVKMKERILKGRQLKKALSDQDLEKRFGEFNKKYFRGRLKVSSIRFVTNQNTRHGSCTPANETIRISHRLKEMPKWVLDYVIIHEMAHLVYPNHSKSFWGLVNQYDLAERGRGFLICKGWEEAGDA